MNILVFKTNLQDESRIMAMEPLLNHHPGIREWNIDRHDHENILRVITPHVSGREIEQMINGAGYFCEELKD